MTQRNWLGNSGAWSDPTQWDTGLPGTADSANFTTSGTYTVEFATTASLVALSAGGAGSATLDVTSGLLALSGSGSSSWNGVIDQSGGSITVQSGTLRVAGTLAQTGGVLALGLGAHLQLP